MAKLRDPAFLFYPESFLCGVEELSMEERGIYITLLCKQHQKGSLKENQLKQIVEIKDEMPNVIEIPQAVKDKFVKDEDGTYYNARLRHEIEKRHSWTSSRHKNGSNGGRPRNPEYCGLTKKEWEALSSEERMDLFLKNNPK